MGVRGKESPLGWVLGFIHNLEVVCSAPPQGEVVSNGPHRPLKEELTQDTEVLHIPYFCAHAPDEATFRSL